MELDEFPADFVDRMNTTELLTVTPEVIHHAAAGMSLLLWRNTSTVETDAHAEGDWNDTDMLRMNTRATRIVREALTELCANPGEDGGEVLLDAMRDVCDLLPTDSMRDRLWAESHRGADFWGSAISAFGPGRVLTCFTMGPPGMFMTCNANWWGHPDYPAGVARLAAMDPPEPGTFADRALDRPWDLSDEQARFMIDHWHSRPRAE